MSAAAERGSDLLPLEPRAVNATRAALMRTAP